MSELDKTAGLGESGQEEATAPDSVETPQGELAAESSDGEEGVLEDTAELPSPFATPVPDAEAVSEAGDIVSAQPSGTESPAVTEAEPVAEVARVEEAEAVENAAVVEEAAAVEEAEPVVEAAAVEEAEPVEEAAAVEEDEPVEEAAAVEEAEPVVEAEAEIAASAEPDSKAEPGGESDEAGEEAASEDGAAPPQAGVPGIDWYIIHTYSGFENKVKESLRTRAEAFGFNDRIGEILIPTEDVVEMRSGNKITSKRMLYPGYVLLQLKMDDELWHVVKNTPRVTGFVGSGPTPTPLTADEVNQILFRQTSSVEKPRAKMTFEKSDRVKIIDGPFTNFTGTVEEANPDRNTLKVMVTIFGRDTPVELEHFQVENERI